MTAMRMKSNSAIHVLSAVPRTESKSPLLMMKTLRSATFHTRIMTGRHASAKAIQEVFQRMCSFVSAGARKTRVTTVAASSAQCAGVLSAVAHVDRCLLSPSSVRGGVTRVLQRTIVESHPSVRVRVRNRCSPSLAKREMSRANAHARPSAHLKAPPVLAHSRTPSRFQAAPSVLPPNPDRPPAPLQRHAPHRPNKM